MYTHKQLIDGLVQKGALYTPHLINAFEKIDRKDFVRGTSDIDEIYADHPLLIGKGQTISQPSTVAFMFELLQPEDGDSILDVGSGSGWSTALLAQSVGNKGRVYGIEIVPDLVEFGTNNISKYNFKNASIEKAENRYGLPKYGPYDKILVSAAADEIPSELVDQLKNGGTMVIPVKNDIVRYIKNKNIDDIIEYFYGFSFVPLIHPKI